MHSIYEKITSLSPISYTFSNVEENNKISDLDFVEFIKDTMHKSGINRPDGGRKEGYFSWGFSL